MFELHEFSHVLQWACMVGFERAAELQSPTMTYTSYTVEKWAGILYDHEHSGGGAYATPPELAVQILLAENDYEMQPFINNNGFGCMGV